MIIYIADAIEPSRDFDGLDELRAAIGAVPPRRALHDDVQPYPADARGAPATPAPGKPSRCGTITVGPDRATRRPRKEQREHNDDREDFEGMRLIAGLRGRREEGHRHHGAGGARPLIGVTDYLSSPRLQQPSGGGHHRRDRGMRWRTKAQMKPLHREGTQDGNGRFLDYGSFVVHVFQPETREITIASRRCGTTRPSSTSPPKRALPTSSNSDRIAKMLGKSSFRASPL